MEMNSDQNLIQSVPVADLLMGLVIEDDDAGVYGCSGVKWITALLAMYAAYYLLVVVKRPSVYSNARLKDFLVSHCSILTEFYWPTVWCVEARLQTVLASLMCTSPYVKYTREVVELPDGGALGLDWAEPEQGLSGSLEVKPGSESSESSSRPVVIVLPGLTASSEVHYILHLIKQCTDLGYRAVAMNYRGNGGVPLRTARSYCGAYYDDIEFVITKHICTRYPLSPIMAVGVSLGGVILTNYLEARGPHTGLAGAMTVSVPNNLFRCMESLREPLNNLLFNQYLCECLKDAAKPHRDIIKDISWDEVKKCRIIVEFDTIYTAPVFNYPDLKSYYTAASSEGEFNKICVPTLCLIAYDDPFYKGKDHPTLEVSQSSHVAMVVTSRGGHIAFLDGWLLPNKISYIQRLLSQFSRAIFNHRHELELSEANQNLSHESNQEFRSANGNACNELDPAHYTESVYHNQGGQIDATHEIRSVNENSCNNLDPTHVTQLANHNEGEQIGSAPERDFSRWGSSLQRIVSS